MTTLIEFEMIYFELNNHSCKAYSQNKKNSRSTPVRTRTVID